MMVPHKPAPIASTGEAWMDCVILAERHTGLAEGIRGLLSTVFRRIFVVADDASLIDGAKRLQPEIVIAELSLAGGNLPGLVERLRSCAPDTRLILLTAHDHPTIARTIESAGVDAHVLKRAIATDLLPAIETLMAPQCRPTRVHGGGA